MFKVANVGWAWSGVPEIAYSYQQYFVRLVSKAKLKIV